MYYLSRKINNVTVWKSIFTRTGKFDKCPTQARYLFIYSWGDGTHVFYIL